MFVCCVCCVLSGRGLCDKLITHPEESYRLWCVVVWSRNVVNEEAIARVGPQRYGRRKKVLQGRQLMFLFRYIECMPYVRCPEHVIILVQLNHLKHIFCCNECEPCRYISGCSPFTIFFSFATKTGIAVLDGCPRVSFSPQLIIWETRKGF